MINIHIKSNPKKFKVILAAFVFVISMSSAVHPIERSVQTEIPEPYLVKDISTLAQVISPQELVESSGKLFFFVDSWLDGFDLWKSDGTQSNTLPITTIPPVNEIFYPGECILWCQEPIGLTDVDGKLFFLFGLSDEYYDTAGALWKSDGTEAGTVILKDGLRWKGFGSYGVEMPINVNGTFYFNADDGVHYLELWKSDGTEAGTMMVKDIDQGDYKKYDGWPPSISDWGVTSLTDVNNILYFSTSDRINGWELWKSDGTEVGTTMVKDINPGINDANPGSLSNVNGTLYFSADDGNTGNELWKSDGSVADTTQVMDILTGPEGSQPRNLENVNGTLFFSGFTLNSGEELWKSDGSENGTIMVKDIVTGTESSSLSNFTAVGDMLYFTADDSNYGLELWKSDGTSDGTLIVKDIYTGTESSNPQNLTAVNGNLFFVANDGVFGSELWKSDGTESGTIMIGDIREGEEGSLPQSITQVKDTVFFSADDDIHGRELWAVEIEGYYSNYVYLPLTLGKAKSCEEPFVKPVIWEGVLYWDCDPIEKKEGVSSIRLDSPEFSDAEVDSKLISVSPNQTYKVTYWVKTNLIVDTATVYGRVIPAQYNNLAQESDAINENRIDAGFSLGENLGGETDWVLRSYTFTTGSKAYFVRLRAPMGLSGRAKGQVWFDGLTIEPIY